MSGENRQGEIMSRTKKATVFVFLTFVISWTPSILAWANGHHDLGTDSSSQVYLLTYAFGPAAAALICSFAFERGQRLKALGLRFSPNWWWLWAFLVPFALTALTVLITALLSPYKLVGVEEMARQLAAMQNEQFSDARTYLMMSAGEIAIRAFGFIVLFTFSEELGWRGYLYHLWRGLGFWTYSLVVGLIWGVWHWPMIYLYGLNYPDHRLLGLFIFPVATVLSATIMTLVRDRGRSVVAAGITHGTSNAVSVLSAITLSAPLFPWTIAGISGIGASAIGVLVIALALRGSPDRTGTY